MCFHFQNVLPFLRCAFIFKMCFDSKNVLSFSECAFIFKMHFHFWNLLSFSKSALNEHNLLIIIFSKMQPSPSQFDFNFYLSFHSNINDVIILLNTQKTAKHFFTIPSHFITQSLLICKKKKYLKKIFLRKYIIFLHR